MPHVDFITAENMSLIVAIGQILLCWCPVDLWIWNDVVNY